MTTTSPATVTPRRKAWRERLRARTIRWCEALRGAHEARTPF